MALSARSPGTFLSLLPVEGSSLEGGESAFPSLTGTLFSKERTFSTKAMLLLRTPGSQQFLEYEGGANLMRKSTVSEFLALDGVREDPGAVEEPWPDCP